MGNRRSSSFNFCCFLGDSLAFFFSFFKIFIQFNNLFVVMGEFSPE